MHANNPQMHHGCPVLVTLVHDGDVRRSIISLKYHRRENEAGWMGRHIADLLIEAGLLPACVTWVPTTSPRRMRRGFDHARLIGEQVARHLGVKCTELLRRVDASAQTGADRSRRLVAPRFTARGPGRREGLLVVVDDVVTTGSTLASARAALVAAGHRPDRVLCAAVAASGQ
jgi:competence protein ComFC